MQGKQFFVEGDGVGGEEGGSQASGRRDPDGWGEGRYSSSVDF